MANMMNERIRDLAKQNNIDITIDGMGFGEGDVEGLVKLIVRECAEICLEANDHKNILRHFGVE
jgi:hypothetical protein